MSLVPMLGKKLSSIVHRVLVILPALLLVVRLIGVAVNTSALTT
jgi:hypothetical protein